MRMRTTCFALALLLLIPAFTYAGGQRNMKRWRGEAQAEMQQIWSRLKNESGFGYAGDIVVGALNVGGHEYFEFNLVGHREYVIKAICDQDCGNVDLYLYDRRNNVVSSNTNRGVQPAIRLSTGHDGPYKIQTAMVACRSEPCFYAVQVFHRYPERP